MRGNNQSGFTLIEMLIVIGIVGLLATISILALDNTRKVSRDTARVANMATIEKALALYFNDNSGYPPVQNCTSYYSTTPDYRTYGINWNNPTSTSLKYYLSSYLTILPVDPLQTDVNRYVYSSNSGDNYQSYGIMVRAESAKYIAQAKTDGGYSGYSSDASPWIESGSQHKYCMSTTYTGAGKNWLLYSGGSCVANMKCCGGP